MLSLANASAAARLRLSMLRATAVVSEGFRNRLVRSNARMSASSNFLAAAATCVSCAAPGPDRLELPGQPGSLQRHAHSVVAERLLEIGGGQLLTYARRPQQVAQRLVFHDRVERLGLQHVLRAGVAELDVLGGDLRRLRALGGADGRFGPDGRRAGCCCR